MPQWGTPTINDELVIVLAWLRKPAAKFCETGNRAFLYFVTPLPKFPVAFPLLSTRTDQTT